MNNEVDIKDLTNNSTNQIELNSERFLKWLRKYWIVLLIAVFIICVILVIVIRNSSKDKLVGEYSLNALIIGDYVYLNGKTDNAASGWLKVYRNGKYEMRIRVGDVNDRDSYVITIDGHWQYYVDQNESNSIYTTSFYYNTTSDEHKYDFPSSGEGAIGYYENYHNEETDYVLVTFSEKHLSVGFVPD